MTEGRRREPSPEHRVLRWLRRTIDRGLSRDPLARYPSMDALLLALDRGRILRLGVITRVRSRMR